MIIAVLFNHGNPHRDYFLREMNYDEDNPSFISSSTGTPPDVQIVVKWEKEPPSTIMDNDCKIVETRCSSYDFITG